MLEKLGKFLQGKKTYLIMVLAIAGIILQEKGITIPDYIWQILAALGLGAVRSAFNKLKSD